MFQSMLKNFFWKRAMPFFKETDGVTFRLMNSDNEFLKLQPPLEIVGSKSHIVKRYFCFMTGRHTGSFFLKVGAACFAVGHIIHNGVIFARNLIQMFSEKNSGKNNSF